MTDFLDQTVKSISESIRFDSSLSDSDSAMPFGKGAADCLAHFLNLAQSFGFETHNYDNYVGEVIFGDGPEFAILGHLDVVPAGNGWTKEPFSPEICDGKMYGRGTIDDKGPVVAALYAMKAVKESGLPLKNHVRHIIGCDEETGHRCIKYYLTKEKCPDLGFSPDGMFAVIHAEKGILRFKMEAKLEEAPEKDGPYLVKVKGGTVVNAVPNLAEVWIGGTREALDKVKDRFQKEVKEEGSASMEEGLLRLKFSGTSAHAMQPWLGKNAVLAMVRFLKEVPFAGRQTQEYFQNLDALFGDGWEGRNLGIACEDQLSGKLSMNLGILESHDGKSTVKVDVRCPVHIDLKTIWKTICLTCQKYGFEPEYWQMRDPLYVPKDSGLVQTLLDVYEEVTGTREEPITIGGGTYCRDVDNFVSFGPVFPGEPELAHEADEYIDLEQMMTCARMYAQALYRLMTE